jgi:hypothetical protein
MRSSSIHAAATKLDASHSQTDERSYEMLKRFSKLAALLTAASLLATGTALAQSGTAHPKAVAHHAVKHSAPAAVTTGTDTDNVQSGDQTSPDTGSQAASSESAVEASGGEEAANDGPGGHEDAPGAEVDHQFEGVE